MQNPGKKAKKPSRSVWVAALFMSGAGAIAWFGAAGPGGADTHARPTGTIAATTAGDAPELAVRRVSQGSLPTRVVIGGAGIDANIAEVGVFR